MLHCCTDALMHCCFGVLLHYCTATLLYCRPAALFLLLYYCTAAAQRCFDVQPAVQLHRYKAALLGGTQNAFEEVSESLRSSPQYYLTYFWCLIISAGGGGYQQQLILGDESLFINNSQLHLLRAFMTVDS